MTFPPGKPILLLALVGLSSGLFIIARPKKTDDSLHIWVFAQSHADSLRAPIDGKPSLADQYETMTGQKVSVDLVSFRALHIRLLSLFHSGAKGEKLPDLVAVEIGSVGQFLRQPPELIPFQPINAWLERDGGRERFVEARFAAWTRGGQIFGIPHDVHPVTLTYRKDLFDEAGIDVEAIQTWDEFADASRRYRKYWREHGKPQRLALELAPASSGDLVTLLLQRGVNLVDADLNAHLTDEVVVDTVARYARWVAGSEKFAGPASPGGENWCKDLERGDIAAMMTPDWRIDPLRKASPALAGKVATRPLPKFDPTDAPTSTIGGTMFAIPRNSRDPENAWKLAEFMLMSPQALAAREQFNGIIPPLREAWRDPTWHQ
ncbi:MAG TPA: extracellular solute-binding protein, partial [Tepidisphaeraceae bacterium]|nr:extracellular solute-binding protein [Tepidisphaeraceae bacterium]